MKDYTETAARIMGYVELPKAQSEMLNNLIIACLERANMDGELHAVANLISLPKGES